MTNHTFFIRHLQRTPVVAIIRSLDAVDAAETAIDCWAAGITLVEVSLAGESAEDSLAAVVDAAEGRQKVGAGTVLSAGDVERALELGATWAVAPNVSAETLSAAADLDCPMLPGVATATDLGHAIDLGFSLVKVFPAALLGPEWIAAMQGPFPAAEFLAVGGITTLNARRYLDAGAVGVGIGSGLMAALGRGLTFLD